MRKLSILALSGAVATIAISLPVTHAQSERPAPVVATAVGFKILPSLREAASREAEGVVDPDTVDSVFSVPNKEIPRRADAEFDDVPVSDPAVSSAPTIQAAPGPIFSVDGISNADNAAAFGFRISPPDTNGDVGPNHFVQTANLLVRVFDKSGVAIAPPFKMSSLFGPLGGICATNDNGDPIVLYDPLADRWLISQFAFINSATPPYHQCIAISRTGDPTGGYFLYDFITPGANLNDYPHFGVWSDGYYMTDNQFLNGAAFNGVGFFAFERNKMLIGDPLARFIYFSDPNIFGALPADMDGLTPPPAGTPNYFAVLSARLFGDAVDGVRIFEFHTDFVNPLNSTLTERADSPVPVAAFDPRSPNGRADIEQPPPALATHSLDAISDRLMFRLQYRNFGDHESLVASHTVNVSGVVPNTQANHQAGVRYYELRRGLPGGTFTANEQATFSPDTDNRWMGSAAMDNQGNLAVGYSVSSLTTFPSVRYAARLATDPPNGLFQGENTLVAGSGVQRSTGSRWGDYSALTVDPVDDCTFWFTTEYYTAASQATSTVGWLTRIGSFRFPSCTAPARGTLTGRVTNRTTGLGIPGASVQTPEGYLAVTDADGNYRMALVPGTYDVQACFPNFSCQRAPGTPIFNGSTTTRNFVLAPVGADIRITKTGPATAAAGTAITYTLNVSNAGPLATSVRVDDETPPGTVFLSVSSTAGTCFGPEVGDPGLVECEVASLAVGSSFSVSVTLQITASSGSIVNTATANGIRRSDDLTGDNTATATTEISCLPAAIRGGPLGANSPDYPSTHGSQTGRLNRNGVVATCETPKAFPTVFTTVGLRAFDAYSFPNESDADSCVRVDVTPGCAANLFPVAYLNSYDPANISANWLADAGASGQVAFSFTLPAHNSAILVMHEVNPGQGCAAYQFTVRGLPCRLADLSVTKTGPDSKIDAGIAFTYSISASNGGVNSASSVVLTDVLPASLAFQSLAAPAGWTCNTPAVGDSGPISCTKDTVAPGETALFTPTVAVKCDVPDTSLVINTAGIVSSTPDPNPFNSSSSTEHMVFNPPPDIGLPFAVPNSLSPADHRMVDVTINYDTNDQCGPVTNVLTVTSNQPESGTGAGDLSPDWVVVDDHHVQLRAERSGGTARVYTITITSTDPAGGTSRKRVTVRVR